jgi:hypothetical protein
LLAAEIDVAALVEAQDPRTYAVEGGVEALLKLLEAGRFSESKLRELPRILRHFYRGALRFRPGGEEPMRRFIAECRRAKAEMSAADSTCNIGDGAFCFWILDFSSLSEAEQTYILGHCGQKYDIEPVCSALINLFPNGSVAGSTPALAILVLKTLDNDHTPDVGRETQRHTTTTTHRATMAFRTTTTALLAATRRSSGSISCRSRWTRRLTRRITQAHTTLARTRRRWRTRRSKTATTTTNAVLTQCAATTEWTWR